MQHSLLCLMNRDRPIYARCVSLNYIVSKVLALKITVTGTDEDSPMSSDRCDHLVYFIHEDPDILDCVIALSDKELDCGLEWWCRNRKALSSPPEASIQDRKLRLISEQKSNNWFITTQTFIFRRRNYIFYVCLFMTIWCFYRIKVAFANTLSEFDR